MRSLRRLLVLLLLPALVGCGGSGTVSEDTSSDNQTAPETGPANAVTEANLNRIVALNWPHRSTLGDDELPAVRLRARDEGERTVQGLAVAFGRDPVTEDDVLEVGSDRGVQSRSLSAGVFQVYARRSGGAVPQHVQVRPRAVLPLVEVRIGDDGRISGGTIALDNRYARGALFVFPNQLVEAPEEIGMLQVHLMGDAIVDRNGRAMDAEFARSQLPTGDRPAETEEGVQGGHFASWFYPTDPPPKEEQNRQVVEEIFSARVDLNTADFEELLALPQVGGGIAGRILAFRNELGEPIRNPLQLTEVQGLTEQRIRSWEGRVRPPLPSQSARVNLNTAGVEELSTLPHVGRTIAGRILEFREQLGGPIDSPLQLIEVPGLTEQRIRGWEGRVEPPLSGQ